jgi:ATP-dependent Clp protease adaptor protein ClpS
MTTSPLATTNDPRSSETSPHSEESAALAANPTPPTTSSTAVKDRPTPAKLDELPPFKILLHNDDVNDISYVVETILDLTPLNIKKATDATFEAHRQGVALLLVTHRERAELYVEQFKSKNLTVSMESAE